MKKQFTFLLLSFAFFVNAQINLDEAAGYYFNNGDTSNEVDAHDSLTTYGIQGQNFLLYLL